MDTITNKNNRYIWVDVIKGLAILLIMFGHVHSSSPFKTYISSFHVPIFFVVSGVLLSIKDSQYDRRNFLFNTVRKNITPYLYFSICAIIINIFFYYMYDRGNTLSVTLQGVYHTIILFGIDALWFIPSYLIAYRLFYLLKSKWQYSLIGFLAFLAVTVILSKFVLYGGYEYSNLTYHLVKEPIILISRSLTGACFILAGYFLVKLYKRIMLSDYMIAIMGVLLIGINIVLTYFIGSVNFSMADLGKYPFMTYLNGFCGTFAYIFIIYAFRKITNHFRFLAFCGKNSLILMCSHMSLKLVFISEFILGHIFYYDTSNILHGILATVIMILIELPIIYLLNGPLKFVLGKKPRSETKQ